MSLRRVKHRLIPNDYKKKFGMKTAVKPVAPKRQSKSKKIKKKPKKAGVNNKNIIVENNRSQRNNRSRSQRNRRIRSQRNRRSRSQRNRRSQRSRNQQQNNSLNVNTRRAPSDKSFGDFILQLFS